LPPSALEQVDMRAAVAELVGRLADEALSLALLARARVLVARTARDHEDPRDLGARVQVLRSLQGILGREPVERELIARIGKASPRLACARRLAVLAIGRPRDLFDPLDLAFQGLEQRIDEARAKPLAKLVARELDAGRTLADFEGVHQLTRSRRFEWIVRSRGSQIELVHRSAPNVSSVCSSTRFSPRRRASRCC